MLYYPFVENIVPPILIKYDVYEKAIFFWNVLNVFRNKEEQNGMPQVDMNKSNLDSVRARLMYDLFICI